MLVIDFIMDNYVMLFELIGLLIMLRISAHISEQMKKQTRIVVALLFAETLIYTLERWTQSFERLSLLRPMLTACLYSIYPIVLICLMQLLTIKKRSKGKMLLLLIPELISIPVYFTSQWTQLVCWFEEDNKWTGGPLRYWPYVIFGFYMVVFLVRNFLYFKDYARGNRLIMTYVVVGPVIGAMLYLIFEYDSDYGALFTSAIVFYYIWLYIHMAKIDPLTSLLNRHSYYEDIRTRAKAITGVVSVDMNELKYFNDSIGHEAGDKALVTIAGILRDHSGRHGRPYRVGGDEFMIFYFNADEREIDDAISVMRAKLEETPYRCAFGYAMKGQLDQLHDVICISDERMYENKAEMKRQTLEQGGTLHGRT